MTISETKAIKQRNITIDMLKGISIIAVLLYHLGLLKSGYLGVDCFFVIGGFLSMPKIVQGIENGNFRFIKYIRSRIVRLLPAVLLISIVSLAVGYVFWLPNDYENLSETVIASTFFSNNILSGITTKNYWDAINEYKPLMHMWYVGILMEYYVLLPIFAITLNKFALIIKKDRLKTILLGIGIITILSFVLFLMPSFSAGDKFYFIPFRLWELTLGGLIGIFYIKLRKLVHRGQAVISVISFAIILAIFCVGLVNYDVSKIGVATTVIGADTVASSDLVLPNGILLVLVVIITCVFLISSGRSSLFNKSKFLSAVGRRSYSIFVWHQVILALYRYSVTNRISILFVIIFFVLLAILSEVNYRFIEMGVMDTNRTVAVLIALVILICGYSGFIYLRAGVVRDVSELGISTANIQRSMHSKYCDRIYNYKDEFEDNGKMNILVVGNSFARDWGNILLESEYCDKINLYFNVHFSDDLIEKIQKADRIFVFENFEDKVPDYVWDNVDRDIVYSIGTKNFGTSNGTIYFHRFNNDYFDQTILLDPGYDELNREKKVLWGDHYIDLIDPVLVEGRVRVFTDDNMYISEDCRHLTEAGAKYYAQTLDLSLYLPR